MLSTIDEFRNAFYRTVGSRPQDYALTELGEDENDVADHFLTEGVWSAQRWLLAQGYAGWRSLSSPLVWVMESNGEHAADLPADFLRAWGTERISALRKPDGGPWGRQVEPREADAASGDCYYIPNEVEVRAVRRSNPPDGLRIDYHYRHQEFGDAMVIEFPEIARSLVVAEAADAAKYESWLQGDRPMEAKIEGNLMSQRKKAVDALRLTKSPRKLHNPVRYGNHW